MEKKNNVKPVHIKDSMEQTENCRLVSLLCIISKNLERCVCISTINNHVKQFISPLQHDFLRKRSCTTQRLSVFNGNTWGVPQGSLLYPVLFVLFISIEKLLCVYEEKDLGVVILVTKT